MSKKFVVHNYKDCDIVTNPKDDKNVYYLLEGQVNIIAEERKVKKVEQTVRKVRKRRQRALEKKREEEEQLGLNLDEGDDETNKPHSENHDG